MIGPTCGQARSGPKLNLPSYSNGESSVFPISSFDNGHFTVGVGAWTIEYLMRMAMLSSRKAIGIGVRMREAAVMGMHWEWSFHF